MSDNQSISVIQTKNQAITAPRKYDPAALKLIKRTCAKDTTDDEFNMFIEICKRQGLDPFRRQIYALVFNKDDAKKRQVSFITGIDGYRAIARRANNYRPDENEPEFEYDEAMKCEHTNPKGIKKATVTVYQYMVDGWYPIKGRALWEEFAPVRVKKEWQAQYDENNQPILQTEGKFKGSPLKKLMPVKGEPPYLEKSTWKDMPEQMLAKCAEAQALRKGWPEEIGGIYTHEEMQKAQLDDVIATEEIDAYEEEQRMIAVNAVDSIPLIMADSVGIEPIPMGQVYDKVVELLGSFESADQIEFWRDRNRYGLQEFWARSKDDALGLKEQIEKMTEELRAKEKAG